MDIDKEIGRDSGVSPPGSGGGDTAPSGRMAAGSPIVASDLDAFSRVLRGGRAGELFENGNPDDLAAAVGRMLDDPARRARLAAAAAAAVREYDWPVVARDVLRVYQAVAPAAGRVPAGAL